MSSISKTRERIQIALSNIFTTRRVGNKTHGDLAEIAIAEYINQFLDGYAAKHVGKDLYRAKSKEEDIEITNLQTGALIPISLKAYGDGPLQLSTDKKFNMFPILQSFNADIIEGDDIQKVFASTVFSEFEDTNVLPIIYDERKSRSKKIFGKRNSE